MGQFGGARPYPERGAPTMAFTREVDGPVAVASSSQRAGYQQTSAPQDGRKTRRKRPVHDSTFRLNLMVTSRVDRR